jgi:cyclase
MSRKRIIPCLDVKVVDGVPSVVKGVKFVNLRRSGDPVELAMRYEDQGADELVFLDITASHEERKTMIDAVKRTSEVISIPFAVGGGINSIEVISEVLNAGADKVGINTAALLNPSLVRLASEDFGPDRITIAIDARREAPDQRSENVNVYELEDGGRAWFDVVIYGGRKATGIDAIEWALKVEELGCGEILLTSMDRDGTGDGYDIPLTRAVSDTVGIPVIASGGASNPEQMLHALRDAGADAALAAGIFHRGEYTVAEVKKYLRAHGIEII